MKRLAIVASPRNSFTAFTLIPNTADRSGLDTYMYGSLLVSGQMNASS